MSVATPSVGLNRNNVSVKFRRSTKELAFPQIHQRGVNESWKKFSFNDDLSNLIFKFFRKFDRFRLCIVFDSRRYR